MARAAADPSPPGSGAAGGWRFWIDRGGTFTDLVGRAPDGALVVRKVLSERPHPAAPRRGGSPGREAAGPPGANADPAAAGPSPGPAGTEASTAANPSAGAHPAGPADPTEPDPAVAALRQVLGLAEHQPLPDGLVEEVRLGTTVATNALLERRVAPVLLLLNRGFADLPRIGDQHRPEIFALKIERPQPLPFRVLEVPGRLAADGRELEPFQREPALEAQLRQALADGHRSCAVALLHAVANPAHERALGDWLGELGFGPVLLSHRVGAMPRWLPRLQTTLAEAALQPVLQAYLDRVRRALGPATRLRVMTSAGVLQAPEQLLAKDTILSGPAGGLVGAVAVARAAGLADRPIIGFDMGGTSTDVFHLEPGAAAPGPVALDAVAPVPMAATAPDPGTAPLQARAPAPAGAEALERQPDTLIAGLRLQALCLPIHTVAAGGGSVLRFEGGRLQVGPASAGAVPGPACYRLGGPLTITDANLLLGRLPPEALPAVFGPGGDQPPDGAVVRERFEALAAAMAQGALGALGESGGDSLAATAASPNAASPTKPPGTPLSPEVLAQGARSIALERMAEAIRSISIQRGHDIRSAVLVCYGGAGGQHACALAERLGVAQVLLHPLAGVLSAYGIGLSRQEALRSRALQLPLDAAAMPELARQRQALLAEASAALEAAGDGPGDRGAARLSLDLRLADGERALEVPWSGSETVAELRAAFGRSHQRRFGFAVEEGAALVMERLQLVLPADGSSGGADPEAGQPGSGSALRCPPPAPAPAPEHSAAADPPSSPAPQCWRSLCLPSGQGDAAASAMAWHRVPCWRRDVLAPGQRLEGPALVLEATGTTVLEPGWGGLVLADGALLLEPQRSQEQPNPQGSETPWNDRPAAPAERAAQRGDTGTVPAADRTCTPHEPTAFERDAVHVEAASESTAECSTASTEPAAFDPVRLELYNHRFAAIAEQMGVRLQQSSRSVNIRERLDFSCALFDARGRLVANAPHIPVHLGSMGESVAALLAAIARGERPPLRPGDAIASNDPYAGGTHLPDITVISPVFAPVAGAQGLPASGAIAGSNAPEAPGEPGATEHGTGQAPTRAPIPKPGQGQGGPPQDAQELSPTTPLFYIACRGHHADVGGISPGSMPPFSRSIAEEGLRLDNVPLIKDGRFEASAWRERLAAGDHPVRDPERLLADLQAQVAANRLGEAELQRLIRQRGVEDVIGGMAAVQRNAAEAVRTVIDRLRPGRHAVELDDGARIVVAVEPDRQRRRVRVDFQGTSPQQPGNLNAPLAITKAVVLYVFRVLVARPIPLNAGCFEPIDLVVPPGCLLHPRPPAAVVGGNVETSQAIANALFGALGVLAAGQGTMNNLSFGNAGCQYYETVAGGSGAGLGPDGQGFDGCDAVQSHMTNSRLTDPEILEARFPVRLERFALRRGSGGSGRWRGGDGVVRLLRCLEPLTLAILSGSRRVPPFGMDGGSPGRCGRNALLRADGRIEELGGSAQVAMAAGDAFLLETPGGGGWGAAPAIDGAPQQPGTAHPPAPAKPRLQGSRGPAAGAGLATATAADPTAQSEDKRSTAAAVEAVNGDPAAVDRPMETAQGEDMGAAAVATVPVGDDPAAAARPIAPAPSDSTPAAALAVEPASKQDLAVADRSGPAAPDDPKATGLVHAGAESHHPGANPGPT
jgi:5-oxoprolinase (ATP-hydrolysing)